MGIFTTALSKSLQKRVVKATAKSGVRRNATTKRLSRDINRSMAQKNALKKAQKASARARAKDVYKNKMTRGQRNWIRAGKGLTALTAVGVAGNAAQAISYHRSRNRRR